MLGEVLQVRSRRQHVYKHFDRVGNRIQRPTNESISLNSAHSTIEREAHSISHALLCYNNNKLHKAEFASIDWIPDQ